MMLKMLKDFRWHLRTRFARGYSLDRVHMGAANGYEAEIVSPRWWDLKRWWIWAFETTGHAEMVLHAFDGNPVFVKVRIRDLQTLKRMPVRVDGKTLVPGPADPRSLRAHVDPHYRGVPDDVLERDGITIPDE